MFLITRILLCLAFPLFGAEVLSTDRPDFTESTGTLPPGFIQFEGGLQRSSQSLPDIGIFTIGGPYPLIRIGLTKRMELRFASDGYQKEDRSGANPEHHSGRADYSVGVKLQLIEEKGLRPAIAVITAISLPSRGSYFSSDGRDPFLKVAWGKSVPAGFDIGGNFNYRWYTCGGNTKLEWAYSVTSGHALPGGFRGFWEVYRIAPSDEPEAFWIGDTGVSRAVGQNVQFDVEIGHTIRAGMPSWVAGVGFSFRSPLGWMLTTH